MKRVSFIIATALLCSCSEGQQKWLADNHWADWMAPKPQKLGASAAVPDDSHTESHRPAPPMAAVKTPPVDTPRHYPQKSREELFKEKYGAEVFKTCSGKITPIDKLMTDYMHIDPYEVEGKCVLLHMDIISEWAGPLTAAVITNDIRFIVEADRHSDIRSGSAVMLGLPPAEYASNIARFKIIKRISPTY